MSDYEDILYKYDSHEAQALLTKSNMLFDEVLRYGVYVYDLVYEYNKEIDGMSNTILGLLFREAMEVTDGIGVLMRSGCVAASWPLVRSFFELYAQIAVMVKDDGESSAMAYMFCRLHDLKTMTQRKIKNGEIESQEAQQELAEYERMLNDAKYKEQHEAWKNYKKQNRASYPKWFNITSNPHSKGIHALLSSLDPDLGIIYNYMSVEAHGSGVTNKLLAVNDKLGMHLLRRPYGLASCVNYCLTSQCRVYSFFVERYLSKEDDDNLLCWFEQRAKEMDELLVLGRKFDEKQHR